MYKLSIILFLLFWPSFRSISQTTADLETDRPDQTETPFSVGKFVFQAENGYSSTTIFNKLVNRQFTSLLRFGLSEKFELRVEASAEKLLFNKNKIYNGLVPLEIGFKANLLEEKGAIPKTSLIAHLTLPELAGSDYTENYYAPNFRFTMQHSLSKKQSLSYNIGGEWSAYDGKFVPLYTLATGYDFSAKWYGYIELFGFFQGNKNSEHSIDAGLAYLWKPTIQFDISAGAGLTDVAPDYYIAVGFSFKLPRR